MVDFQEFALGVRGLRMRLDASESGRKAGNRRVLKGDSYIRRLVLGVICVGLRGAVRGACSRRHPIHIPFPAIGHDFIAKKLGQPSFVSVSRQEAAGA
jgi:hypothetical protein